MQTFTCPECGFESTFDPLYESAHCPKCGYAPQPPRRPDTAELLAASQLLAGREPVVDLYKSAKKLAPFNIILVRQDDCLYTFGGDAQALARFLGRGVLMPESIPGTQPPTACLPLERRYRVIGALNQVGRQVKIADRAVLTCARCGRKSLSEEVFSPAASCSRCGYVPEELQSYIQNLIDQGIEASRKGDHQKASGYLKKAYRSKGTPQQRRTIALWLADLSVNLYQKREYLKEALGLARDTSDIEALQGRLRQVEALIDPDRKSPPTPAFVSGQAGGEQDDIPWIPGESTQPLGTVSMQVFPCAACGAAYLVGAETVSLTCPHCASNYIIQDKTEKELIPPGGLIPFSVSEEQAQDGFRDWLSQQWLVHTDRRLPPVGFYLPVWALEMEGEVTWSGKIKGGLLPVSRSGKRLISYDDIFIPALQKMPKYLEMEIMQFEMEDIAPFDQACLTSWPAEIYTLNPTQASALARGKALAIFRASLEQLYGPINDLTMRATDLKAQSYKLVLVPVWVAHYLVRGRRYEVAINGQTGTVRGEIVDLDGDRPTR